MTVHNAARDHLVGLDGRSGNHTDADLLHQVRHRARQRPDLPGRQVVDGIDWLIVLAIDLGRGDHPHGKRFHALIFIREILLVGLPKGLGHRRRVRTGDERLHGNQRAGHTVGNETVELGRRVGDALFDRAPLLRRCRQRLGRDLDRDSTVGRLLNPLAPGRQHLRANVVLWRPEAVNQNTGFSRARHPAAPSELPARRTRA